MPELAELHHMAGLVNQAHEKGHVYHSWSRSEVSREKLGPDPPLPKEWLRSGFSITARARGKELMMTFLPVAASSSSSSSSSSSKSSTVQPVFMLFRAGMSARIAISAPDNLHKHDHLTFFSSSPLSMALSWRDVRRFGRWLVVSSVSDWDAKRGPCVMSEYALFRAALFAKLESKKKAFSRSICEEMLDQKNFNGIGNYLRAEILIRCPHIDPWKPLRPVLEALKAQEPTQEAEMEREQKNEQTVQKKQGTRKGARSRSKASSSDASSSAPEPSSSSSSAVSSSPSSLSSSSSSAAAASSDVDFLAMCQQVCREAFELGSYYGSYSTCGIDTAANEAYVRSVRRRFSSWRRCYGKRNLGMVSTRDKNNRTMWHEKKHSIEGKTVERTDKDQWSASGSDMDDAEEEEKTAAPASDNAEPSGVGGQQGRKAAAKGKSKPRLKESARKKKAPPASSSLPSTSPESASSSHSALPATSKAVGKKRKQPAGKEAESIQVVEKATKLKRGVKANQDEEKTVPSKRLRTRSHKSALVAS